MFGFMEGYVLNNFNSIKIKMVKDFNMHNIREIVPDVQPISIEQNEFFQKGYTLKNVDSIK